MTLATTLLTVLLSLATMESDTPICAERPTSTCPPKQLIGDADCTVPDSTWPSNHAIMDAWEKSSSIPDMKKTVQIQYPGFNFTCSDKTFQTSVRRLNEKGKKLKRNKNEKGYWALMSASYEPPKSETDPFTSFPSEVHETIKKVYQKATVVSQQNRELKRNIEDVEITNENLTYQINNSERKVNILLNLLQITNDKYDKALEYKQDSYRLQEELGSLEEQYTNLGKQLDHTTEQLEEHKAKLRQLCTRNVNKKLKRREAAIKKKDETISEKERELESMKEECEKKDQEMECLKKEKRNLLVKVCRLRKSKNQSPVIEENMNQIEILKNEVKVKENQISQLEQINILLQDPIIETFHDGKFSNEIRSTIMSLLSECGVSQSKVNDVIKTVLFNLTGKTLSRLPSTGVKSRLMLEAKRVAQRQVAEAMLKSQPTSGNTLHQDGTSKFHRHFQSFQVTTSDGTTLSAGLSEVARGDASTLFDEFESVVSQLASSIQSSNSMDGQSDTAGIIAKLVTSIVSTMSDQGSVNPLFNEKLRKLREDLLPTVYTHWDTLTVETQHELSSLFCFFCKMHIFVNMASEADKCLSQYEKQIVSDGRNPYAFNWNESGAARLIRTVSKALTSHGCEKSGVGGHFQTYLKEKGIQNKLITFRGHRFNHLFYAAGATYYHLNDIKDFLVKWADPNDLLRSVQFDVNELVYISGIRALGIIDKVVTGPFWRLIENAPNVLSLNKHLFQLKIQLEQWSQDASSVLAGDCLFNEEIVAIHKDEVYEHLIAPTENPVLETYTQMALELTFGGMLLILERQAKDQLPGGKYWSLGQSECEKVSAVPSTNTASERDFAQLDMLMRAKPSASTTAYESIIMWSNNRTSAWLETLSEEEYNKCLEDARKNAPNMAKQIKEKQQALHAKKLQHLHERQEKKVKQEEKTHSTKVKLTQKLTALGGLWGSDQQLFSYRDSQSEKVYREALITQITFRKNVLGSKGQRELFQQQFKGKVYNTNELESNLLQIIALNEESEAETEDVKLKYRSAPEVEELVTSLKTQLKGKVLEGRNKILVSQQKEVLPKLSENPDLLVGKPIKHKCRDPDSREVEWFSGKVLNISKRNPRDSMKTEYTIKYDEDPDEWCFPLLKDMQNGDLIIVE